MWLRGCGRWPPDRLPIWATLRPHEPASMRPSGADRRAGYRRLNRARDVSGGVRECPSARALQGVHEYSRRHARCSSAFLPSCLAAAAGAFPGLALLLRGRLPPAPRNPARSMAATALNGASHAQRRRRHGATSRTGRSRLNGGFGDIDAAQVRSSLLRLPAMGRLPPACQSVPRERRMCYA